MKISSSVFDNNQKIPIKYTCDGENINPPLLISDISEKAKCLALIVDDPDAPNKTWLHWTLWNIPIKDNREVEIEEGEIPENSIEGITDFGTIGYGGPCPPSGIHRYFFKIFSLDSLLELKEGASLKELEEEMKEHILEKEELIGLYSRD
jgi:Raf kinase inhibitor-like YbhB/YbcL family protein